MKFDKVVKIGLVLSPLFLIFWLYPTIFLSNRVQFKLFFQFFAVTALALSIKNRWFRIFLILAIADMFRHSFIMPCFGTNEFRVSTLYLNNIIWAALVFFLITTFIQKKEISGILKVVFGMCIVMMGFMALQLTGVWPIRIGGFFIGGAIDATKPGVVFITPAWWKIGFPGLIGQCNILGAYLGICTPLFLVYGKIKKVPILLFILLIYIVLTRTTMSVVSALTGILFFELFRVDRNWKRLGIWVCGIAVTGILFLKFVDKPSFQYHHAAVKYIFDNLSWTGHGFGVFMLKKVLAHPGPNGWLTHPHSDFLQVLYSLGRIGLILPFGYLVTRFIRFLITEKDNVSVALAGCVAGLIVNAVFSWPFHHAVSAFLGVVLLGLMEVKLGGRKWV